MKEFLNTIIKENADLDLKPLKEESLVETSVSATFAVPASELPYNDATDSVELKAYEAILNIIKEEIKAHGINSDLKIENLDFRGFESNNNGSMAYYGFKLSGPLEELKKVVGEDKVFFGSFEKDEKVEEKLKDWKFNFSGIRQSEAFSSIKESYDRYK